VLYLLFVKHCKLIAQKKFMLKICSRVILIVSSLQSLLYTNLYVYVVCARFCIIYITVVLSLFPMFASRAVFAALCHLSD